MMMKLSIYETATVLAALRYWQRNVLDNELKRADDVPEWQIATDDGNLFTPLKSYQVDHLCDVLNGTVPNLLEES
jgi:hypothetical protein